MTPAQLARTVETATVRIPDPDGRHGVARQRMAGRPHRHPARSLGPHLRLHPRRQGLLPRGPGGGRRHGPRVARAARPHARQPRLHEPRRALARRGGGHAPVPRHRHRHPDLAQPARDRPGRGPRVPRRVRRQRPDRPHPLPGPALQHPRGPHRVPGGRLPRSGGHPERPRTARDPGPGPPGRPHGHRHRPLHAGRGRRGRGRAPSPGAPPRGQPPGDVHRHRRVRPRGGGPRRPRVRGPRHADAPAHDARGRGVLRGPGPDRARHRAGPQVAPRRHGRTGHPGRGHRHVRSRRPQAVTAPGRGPRDARRASCPAVRWNAHVRVRGGGAGRRGCGAVR
ncbi:conserved hypothetical protein [Streptomyces misionensis JCM 4497]